MVPAGTLWKCKTPATAGTARGHGTKGNEVPRMHDQNTASRWRAEPTPADLRRDFPGWHVYIGTDGLYYGRCEDPPMQARGEDPQDLRDEIIREIWKQTGEVHET